MTFTIKWTDRRTPEGAVETHNENRVKSVDDAKAVASEWISDFNATEFNRYGHKACPRTIVEVRLVEDGLRQHEWHKLNIYTVAGDGHAARDKWKCDVCGCEGLRYGIGGIRRTGKWRAKKYEFCQGQEDQ